MDRSSPCLTKADLPFILYFPTVPHPPPSVSHRMNVLSQSNNKKQADTWIFFFFCIFND